MKKAALLTVLILCVSSVASAQWDAGSIDIFSDALFQECSITDTSPGLISVYVVATHIGDGSTASQWIIEASPGVVLTHVGDINRFPTVIGDTQNGISVAYMQCLTGDQLLVTVNYFGSGLTPACETLSIMPDPAAPTGLIELVDCQNPNQQKVTIPNGGIARINPDGTCPCVTPTEDTTWGGVKALYR